MGPNAAPMERLIEQFAKLNGIGRKGATRLAYQVLAMEREDAFAFAEAIRDAHEKIHRCAVCQNFTEAEVCPICSDDERDATTICVVESPRDVSAFEHTHEYNGMYHVLHGLISPMNGISSEQVCVKELLDRLRDSEVQEVIMATNSTVDGDLTASYLSDLIKPLGFITTRLASGLPTGSSLEYVDDKTLSHALQRRQEL